MQGSRDFFASFAVRDLDSALRFYRDVLGMQVDKHEEGFLQLGGAAGVMVYPKPDHRPADFTVLNFKVPNIEAAVAELAGKGVRFEHYGAGPLQTDAAGIHRDDMATIAWFKDPSGNFLALIEQSAQDR